jgi:hypothetical protein
MGGTVCPSAGRARKNSAARMAFGSRLCNKCATTAWGGWPVSCPIKRDVKRNIFPSPRHGEGVGRLHPAAPLATRSFGFDRLKRAAKRRVQSQLMVPNRLSHDVVVLDAIQFPKLRKPEMLATLKCQP